MNAPEYLASVADLGLPALAAVGRGQDETVLSHRPASASVDEVHAGEILLGAAVLHPPGLAVVARDEDGAVAAHRPAGVRTGKLHAPEGTVGGARLDLLPMLAAVARGQDDAVFSHRPAGSRIPEVHEMQRFLDVEETIPGDRKRTVRSPGGRDKAVGAEKAQQSSENSCG